MEVVNFHGSSMMQQCLICAAESLSNYVDLTLVTSQTSHSETPVEDKLRNILTDKWREPNSDMAMVVCLPCFQLIDQYDSLETRLQNVKKVITEKYCSNFGRDKLPPADKRDKQLKKKRGRPPKPNAKSPPKLLIKKIAKPKRKYSKKKKNEREEFSDKTKARFLCLFSGLHTDEDLCLMLESQYSMNPTRPPRHQEIRVAANEKQGHCDVNLTKSQPDERRERLKVMPQLHKRRQAVLETPEVGEGSDLMRKPAHRCGAQYDCSPPIANPAEQTNQDESDSGGDAAWVPDNNDDGDSSPGPSRNATENSGKKCKVSENGTKVRKELTKARAQVAAMALAQAQSSSDADVPDNPVEMQPQPAPPEKREEKNNNVYDEDVSMLGLNPGEKLRMGAMLEAEDGNITYTCSYCDEVFVDVGMLKAHVRVRHRPEPLTTLLPVDMGFGTKVNCGMQLMEVTSNHELGKPFICIFCDGAFKFKSNVLLHYKEKHTPYKPFSCVDCKEAFRRSMELSRHRVYYCPFRKRRVPKKRGREPKAVKKE